MKSIADLALLLIVPLSSLFGSSDGLNEDCVDFFGNIIMHGYFYVPGPSACTMCVCHHSQSLWCKAIYCDPPFFCKRFTVGEKCCEFKCLDTPEEIAEAKERLRKRKRFLGIFYSEGNQTKPQTLTMFLSISTLLLSGMGKVIKLLQ